MYAGQLNNGPACRRRYGGHVTVSDFEMFHDHERSNWVRLRTLVMLRWFAIAGQMLTIFVAVEVLKLQIAVGFAVSTIGVSIIANLISSAIYPKNRRVSEREATVILAFDILQLSLLLYLTGGLNNPFAVLVLAPVAIAATVLHLRSTLLIGALTVVLISLISQFNLPLTTSAGDILALPELFQFGFWCALVIGVVFLAIYARQVTSEMNTMSEALIATQIALAREQKLTDLGGVVAATAHELGTPLATIKLVSSELADDLADRPEILEDIALIRQQADRCRDILQSMGRAGKDDLHLRNAPFEAIVREAAEPHLDRGKQVFFDIGPEDGADDKQPVMPRRPEIIHGLRNLIQNAVDFAATRVEIELSWNQSQIIFRILDDGAGFPQSVIGRIGDPFMHRKRTEEDRRSRPGYEGMGLGLFIAKTLLERSGASLFFANGGGTPDAQTGRGAIVTVTWARLSDEEARKIASQPLGNNQPMGN